MGTGTEDYRMRQSQNQKKGVTCVSGIKCGTCPRTIPRQGALSKQQLDADE